MPSFKFLALCVALLAQLAFPAFAQTTFPPTPAVRVAVNPLANKVYTVNEAANTVSAFNASTGASTTIPVGPRPFFIAANPVTNRVYVSNANDGSLSVIDGATDTLVGTYPIGSIGPIAINPVTNVVYVVRLTGPGTDEVTYVDGATNEWYTIATNSFQPNALAVNPVTNKIYVAHYATGDVRVIGGTYDANDFHPATVSIGVWSKPFAIAANPVTNKVYAITEDSRGPIVVIDGASNAATFPAVTPGHAQGPQAIVVNPVSNKVYAAFANEVIVIDGSTNSLTYVPVTGAGSGTVALGINFTTNRIFVASALGTLTVIDGDSDTIVSTESIPVGTSSVGVNPLTGASYYFGTTLQPHPRSAAETDHAIPLVATITPLGGNASPPTGTITINASSTFSPAALAPRAVYFQMDSRTGPWTKASGSGPFTASFANLAPGTHTIHAVAVDGQDAPLATGQQSNPLVGQVATYTFTVSSASRQNASVSLTSSRNPSQPGESVTFTASVTGAGGTPTGTAGFFAGSTAIAGCSAVALTGGAAACSTSALAAGTHSITVQYSGDSAFNAAVSSALSQTVSTATGTLVNLSTRGPVLTGSDVMIGGFIIGGSTSKTVVVRARGPSLAQAGITNALANPLLQLVRSSDQATIAVNDNWGSAANAAQISSSGFAPPDAAESAILMTLAPGAYTAIVSGAGGGTGVGMVEVFEVDHPEVPLINIATRGKVLTGNDVMIGGFIVQGNGPQTVVVRARGPSMSQQGVPGTLANPLLQLIRSSDQAQIAVNDNWGSAANAAEIAASGFAPPDAQESAILVTLQPGAYTAIVTGVGGGTGVGLVEVFRMP